MVGGAFDLVIGVVVDVIFNVDFDVDVEEVFMFEENFMLEEKVMLENFRSWKKLEKIIKNVGKMSQTVNGMFWKKIGSKFGTLL